ncbi:MAG TPA: aminotransferase class I/II-fold pyridoxal phosphate-dependent enzyme [Vicinamibacterales bacterium]|jgi:DNA-binding transcriptional MocR family regulator|nr:aminotransferase class I/II-fold pyridoxal phosphate-dependent enzyme [Vicinamibacterales bacterium]
MKQIRIAGRSAVDISRAVEQAIHAGQLAADQVVPTVRELAASLKVSPATVAAAYRALQARGLLVGQGRRGTRVRGHVQPHARAVARPVVREGLFDLATGNPDPELLPSLDAALRALAGVQTFYDAAPEVRALTTFARAEFAADGINAESLVVTSGALDAIERILREHARPGDHVLIEDPVAPAILDILTTLGMVPAPVPVDAEGPRVEPVDAALRRRPRAMIVTPRAQNPTGAVISRARAIDLRRLLRAQPELLVIENDPCAPITGAALTTLTEDRLHWAAVRSTSKYLGPDLRVALVAGDALTLARVRGRQAAGPRWVSRLLQHLVLSLWSDPANGRRLARAADVYAYRRGAFVQALAANGVTVSAVSGFNVWVPVRHEATIVQQLSDRGWAVAPGERFRLQAAPGIRVTTSVLEPADAIRCASDLAEALQRQGGPALA